MMIFFRQNHSIISLSATNITLIKQTQNVISIKYHTGEYYMESASRSRVSSDIEVFHIYYPNEDDAIKKMKDFYVATSNGKNAFMF